jgi:type IV secretory pathway ATPase VirB11/archaellum biosynthesis ATPase
MYGDEMRGDTLALQGRADILPSITPEQTSAFEHYIQTLQERNVTLIFFNAPYHPLRYVKYQDAKEENPKIMSLDDVEVYIQNFADRNGIVVIGSYNPHKYNLTNREFLDGIHPTPQAVAKIISAHSRELYDLLYTDIYPTYDEYAIALAENQTELFA